MAPPRRSKLGLDLTKFAAFVISQPTRRPRGQGTRSLGPMPIDIELMAALQRYADRHETSRRAVIECLLRELLENEPAAVTEETGESA